VSADIEMLWVIVPGRVIFKKQFSSNEIVIWLCSLPEVLFSMFFSVRLIFCQSIKSDFVVIFQDLCSKRMDLRSWLLCGCQYLEARDLTSVCKQSLIAKKDVNLSYVFSGILDC